MVQRVARRAVGGDVEEKPADESKTSVTKSRSKLTNRTVRLPSCRIEITFHKVIERPHVLLFRKQNVVGDTLENLLTDEKIHTLL